MEQTFPSLNKVDGHYMFGVEQKIFIVFEISEVRFIPAFPCCFST